MKKIIILVKNKNKNKKLKNTKAKFICSLTFSFSAIKKNYNSWYNRGEYLRENTG